MNKNYDNDFSRCLKICPSMKPVIERIQESAAIKAKGIEELNTRVVKGDAAAKKTLKEIYSKYAVRISLKYAERYNIPFDELFSEAAMAMIITIDRAAVKCDTIYLTVYIKKNIECCIQRYILKQQSLLNLQWESYNSVYLIEKEYYDCPLTSQRQKIKYISEKTGLDQETVEAVLLHQLSISLEYFLEDSQEIVSYDGESDIIDTIYNNELKKSLSKSFDHLTARERTIVYLRYGIDCRRHTFPEIARMFGIKRINAVKICERALEKVVQYGFAEDLRKFYIYENGGTNMATACFTGHRELSGDINELKSRLYDVLERAITKKNITIFYAGGAIGWDTLAAQTVIELRNVYPQIQLHLVLPCPFKEQTKKWNDDQKDDYKKILKQADSVEYTSDHYHKDCMKIRNARLVELADYCFCYFDSSNNRTGTAQTVRMAINKKIMVVNFFGERN